ncbi:integrase catalytic domain-containing protein [Trichonephila clavipes]|uniref:Integrase catalytic domain-containing protein n=1 Tax=Trichonephila clavipes TaxID=2585209 RepID=A0A8X6VME7_TRICX|nr:integrase catalytic domain-containing protein [Trichonephila clavipes]
MIGVNREMKALCLNYLQQRKKWIVNKGNLKLGDTVLIREENLPPCKWLLGRVVEIYMGKDKKVRVEDIKTIKGDQGDAPEIMDEILIAARDLELEVNKDDIEELIIGHEDELTIENSKKF